MSTFSPWRLALVAALAAATAAGSAQAAAPARPHCTIRGTAGADRLTGTPARDVICAGAGNDVVRGLGGDDLLIGGAGNDRLSGGPGDDRLFGGPGRDVLRGGSGDDRAYDGPAVKGSQDTPTHLDVTYDLPAGTTTTWKYLGGNCTKWEYAEEPSERQLHDAPPQSSYIHLFTAKGDWFGSCAYEKSNAWYRVTIRTPNGNSGTIDFNVQQLSSPNYFVRKYTVECDAGTIPCAGESDTAGGDSPVVPKVRLGPITDPRPAPPHNQCGGDFRFSVGDTLTDQHVCTVEGNPLPDVAFRDLPEGITAKRWPTPRDSWIVLNGKLRRPGLFVVHVDASLPSGWKNTQFATLDVSR